MKFLLHLIIPLVLLGGYVYFYTIDKSEATKALSDTDITAPSPPILEQTPNPVTNNKNVSLLAKGEVGSHVYVYLNQNVVEELDVDETTKFIIDLELKTGDNEIYFTSIDKSGNYRERFNSYSINYQP